LKARFKVYTTDVVLKTKVVVL